MTPSRPLYWNIDALWIFYLLVAIALISFGLGMAGHARVWWRLGREGRLRLDFGRLGNMVRDGVIGVRIFRGDPVAGVMHLLIAWGFFGLFIGTTLVAIHEYIVHFLVGTTYLVFSVAMEVCGLMLIVGLLWASLRRVVRRPVRVLSPSPLADALPLAWLGVIGVTGFVLEGFRIAAQDPAWGEWSFAGAMLSTIPLGADTELIAYQALWWVHGLLSLALIAWIPHGKLLHTLAAPLNLMAAPDRKGQRERHTTLRADQLLSLDACTRCGRCTEACPSAAAEEPLSPREIVASVRNAPALEASLLSSSKKRKTPSIRETMQEEPLWHCTSCRACQTVCPVDVVPLELIATMRGAVVEDGQAVPTKLGEVLERVYKYNNPWISKKGQKAAWSKGLDVPDLSKKQKGKTADWLYFVGCTTALDTRAQNIATSLAKAFDAAGLSFGTLGKKEPCCGDIARRVGEEGLFEEGRDATLKLLRKRELKRLIVTSPHCYDTLANAYPEEDELEVVHYAQTLARLVDEGALKFPPSDGKRRKVTYHDPCYLGRHGGVYDEPRKVLEAIPAIDLVEMPQSGENSLCCGGGGGRMWQELPNSGDLSGRRIQQAAATGADVVVTACPLCLIMLEDARKTSGLEDRIEVRDLSELVATALEEEK